MSHSRADSINDLSFAETNLFELNVAEGETSVSVETAASRPLSSSKQKASVIIGAGLSQLPIWGTFGCPDYVPLLCSLS